MWNTNRERLPTGVKFPYCGGHSEILRPKSACDGIISQALQGLQEDRGPLLNVELQIVQLHGKPPTGAKFLWYCRARRISLSRVPPTGAKTTFV